MKRIELENGFKTELCDEVMNNMELLDALEEMQEENPLAVSKVLNLVLGKEKKKELYDVIREPEGRVPVEKVSDCIKEIIEKFGEAGKN